MRITAFVGNVPAHLICAPDDTPCPKRMPGIQVELDVDGRRRVFGLPTDDPPPPRGVRMVDAGGFSDGPPVQWSIIRVEPSVTTVRMQTGAHSYDEMRPVRGDAVVAATGPLNGGPGSPLLISRRSSSSAALALRRVAVVQLMTFFVGRQGLEP